MVTSSYFNFCLENAIDEQENIVAADAIALACRGLQQRIRTPKTGGLCLPGVAKGAATENHGEKVAAASQTDAVLTRYRDLCHRATENRFQA